MAVILLALAYGAAVFLLLGYRGQSLQWHRLFCVSFFLILFAGETSGFLTKYILPWVFPTYVLIGYIGESFNSDQAKRLSLQLYEKAKQKVQLNQPIITIAALVAMMLFWQLYESKVLGYIGMLIKNFFLLATPAVFLWRFFNRQSGPSVAKDQTDILSTKENYSDAKKVNQAQSGVLAGSMGDETVYAGIEDRGLVIGPPGTGKTAFLIHQLLDWCESGKSFVVLDSKPEIYSIVEQKLKEKGYTLHAFNPTQADTAKYNLLDDISSEEQIGEMAATLIPSPSAENAVFNETARDLLDMVISHLKCEKAAVSLPDVRAFVDQFSDSRDFFDALRESPSEEVKDILRSLQMTGTNQRLLGSVFATFRSNMRFLRYPKIRQALAQSDFSFSELTQPKVGIFLQFEEASRELTTNLSSLIISHLLRYLIIHHERAPVLLLLDEIGTVPLIAGLKEKLNTIRSRKIPTWMYWQSIEQMQIYGKQRNEGPNTILGACDMQMVFRLNDNASAQWFSDKIGTVDRVVDKVGRSYQGWEETTSTSKDLVTEPVIRPHQLQKLDQGEVVCMYKGKAWRGMATPYYERWREFERSNVSVVSEASELELG